MNERTPYPEHSEVVPNAMPPGGGDDDQISATLLLRITWSYRRAISLFVAVSMAILVTGLLVITLRSPTEEVGTLGFRLLFEGASAAVYPNGNPFSSSEITARPVLTEVFESNGLDRYVTFKEFSDSMFVLESNDAVVFLGARYRDLLEAPGLTAVDRDNLEEEYEAQRLSLGEALLSLNLRQDGRRQLVPPALEEKVLSDTLEVWAMHAEERQGVLRFDVPVLTTNVLDWGRLEAEDYLIAADIVRTQVDRIAATILELQSLPGAAVVRVDGLSGTLQEARIRLEDISRFDLGPMHRTIRTSGLSKNRATLTNYLADQLYQRKRVRQELEEKVSAREETLSLYMLQRGVDRPPRSTTNPTQSGDARASSGVGTQLDGSFFDRLLEISSAPGDLAFRQDLTNSILAERGLLAEARSEETFYEELIAEMGPESLRGGPRQELVGRVEEGLKLSVDRISDVILQVGAIHVALSEQNLRPAAFLYETTSPYARARTGAGYSPSVAILYLVSGFMLSVLAATFGALFFEYFKRDIVSA